MEDNKLFIEPHNPGGGEIITKTVVGAVIGTLIAFLIFIVLILLGGMFEQAITNSIAQNSASTTNPLLPLILIVIAFFATFVGNSIISGVYNLFFSNKYYDIGKIFKLSLINNIILFFIFIPLYILFFDQIETLFIVLAFHISFSVFLSLSNIEFTTNPNYVSVHMIGTSLGFLITLLVFGIINKATGLSNQNAEHILLSTPPVLAYTLIPLFHSLWEKLYYKFYEMNNNFLYIPSLDEVMVNEEDEEEVNVES